MNFGVCTSKLLAPVPAQLLAQVAPELGLEWMAQDRATGMAPGMQHLIGLGPAVEFEDGAGLQLAPRRLGIAPGQFAQGFVGAHPAWGPVGEGAGSMVAEYLKDEVLVAREGCGRVTALLPVLPNCLGVGIGTAPEHR